MLTRQIMYALSVQIGVTYREAQETDFISSNHVIELGYTEDIIKKYRVNG